MVSLGTVAILIALFLLNWKPKPALGCLVFSFIFIAGPVILVEYYVTRHPDKTEPEEMAFFALQRWIAEKIRLELLPFREEHGGVVWCD